MDGSRALLAWIFHIRHRVRAATKGLICPLGQAGGGLHKGKGLVTPLPPLSVCAVTSFCPPLPTAGAGSDPAAAHTVPCNDSKGGSQGTPATAWRAPAQHSSHGSKRFSLGQDPGQPAGHWATLTSWAAAGMFQTAPGTGLPTRAEPDAVLDPSGWLCQSQGVNRPQAWQALQPCHPGWAPGRSCWQWRANPWQPQRRVIMLQPHCLRSSTGASQGP